MECLPKIGTKVKVADKWDL